MVRKCLAYLGEVLLVLVLSVGMLFYHRHDGCWLLMVLWSCVLSDLI
jgi:hypothetical protein